MNDTNEQERGGFMQRLQESPRTVSALIIILIVAAAIYAFSGDEAGETGADLAGGPGIEEEAAADGADGAEDGETTDEAEATAEDDGDEAVQTATPTPAPAREAERTGTGFVEVAAAGDGITHLARRASTRWLSENQVDFAVTDEHRIYIEDYIQNRLGTQALAVNDTQTITFDMIREAVDAAQGLNETQLQNLSQYTHALQ